MSKNSEKIFIEPWIDEEGWNQDVFNNIETPCYIVSQKHLERNLKILNQVEKNTGCHVLMALKGFSMFSMFPLVKKYISGTEASSVNEARLGYKEFGKEVHVFSPSYTDKNIKEYLKYANHLVFNSFSQWNKFKNICKGKVSCGLRVNLEHSEVENPMYDPSSPNSHFGVIKKNFEIENLEGLEGLHFHNLCELGADALERSLKVFEEKFGEFLPKMKWVNFGGGHHITRKDYDVDLLCKIINDFKKKYPHLEVYLEPGEAIALNAGVLVGEIIDIFKNNINIAALDVSATTHMPDVLEMPYLPTILGAKPRKDGDGHIYRLVGPSCLTGDVIGEYLFKDPLEIGQKLVFLNMAIYTMVKNNTFNGVNLPNIAILDKNPARPRQLTHNGEGGLAHDSSGVGGSKIKIIKKFDYSDFKNRLS